MDNKEQLEKELMSYGKKEIVSAILDMFGYEYIAGNILRSMHEKRSKALLDAEKKAMDRAKDAWNAYIEWINGVGTEFGKMSNEELEKSLNLAREAEKASDERDRMIERVERFFREGT